MAVIGNAIRVSDLINSMAEGLGYTAGNVGSAYKLWVPDVLKSSYSFSHVIPVQDGSTPTLTWTNRSETQLIPFSTLESDLNTFLTSQGLTESQIGNATIGTDVVIKMLTALYCYITARFASVYSPFITETAIFFVPNLSPTVDVTPIVDISPLPVTEQNVQTIVNSIISMAVRRLRGFCAVIPTTFTQVNS